MYKRLLTRTAEKNIKGNDEFSLMFFVDCFLLTAINRVRKNTQVFFLTSIILWAFFAINITSPAKADNSSIKVFHLQDGHTVVIEEVHSNPIVTVDTWVRTGSINENDKNNGVSHFLEHLIFKGTKNHKVGEAEKILESKGATYNAATSKDFTHFYTTIASQYADTALDLQADMLQNAIFPVDELNRERKVVQEEIRRSIDNPDRIVFDNLNAML